MAQSIGEQKAGSEVDDEDAVEVDGVGSIDQVDGFGAAG